MVDMLGYRDYRTKGRNAEHELSPSQEDVSKMVDMAERQKNYEDNLIIHVLNPRQVYEERMQQMEREDLERQVKVLCSESQAYIRAHNEGLQKAIDWHIERNERYTFNSHEYAIQELSKKLLKP